MKAQVTPECREWLDSLDANDLRSVFKMIEMLEFLGVHLRHPRSSEIKTSKYGLRELRISGRNTEIRVVYGFTKNRDAVLLIGGVKKDERFYRQIVGKADKIWERYR